MQLLLQMKGTRTMNECRLKWMNELAPDFVSTSVKWKESELGKMADIVAEMREGGKKPDWDEVAVRLNVSWGSMTEWLRWWTGLENRGWGFGSRIVLWAIWSSVFACICIL